MPSATAPEPKPAAAAPPPSRPAPTATQVAPAPAPAKAGPHHNCGTRARPNPSAPRDNATLEAGQFADETTSKARCPSDTVVWVNLPSKVYHFAETKSYGTTKRGSLYSA